MYIDVIEKTAAVSNEKDKSKGRRKGRKEGEVRSIHLWRNVRKAVRQLTS